MNISAWLKILSGAFLFINALIQITTKETWWFIQNVNLIFHEAGHMVFMFFGETLHIIGGSLLEILIPFVVLFHFLLSKQYFSAGFASWWLATALLSVSIYVTDAQERALPLITRDVSTHDWFNLLSKYDVLRYDNEIGFIFWCAALIAAGLILFFLSKDESIKNTLSHSS